MVSILWSVVGFLSGRVVICFCLLQNNVTQQMSPWEISALLGDSQEMIFVTLLSVHVYDLCGGQRPTKDVASQAPTTLFKTEYLTGTWACQICQAG